MTAGDYYARRYWPTRYWAARYWGIRQAAQPPVDAGVSWTPGGYSPEIERQWHLLREKEEAKARKPELAGPPSPAEQLSEPEPVRAVPRLRIKPKLVPRLDPLPALAPARGIALNVPRQIEPAVQALTPEQLADEDDIEAILLALPW